MLRPVTRPESDGESQLTPLSQKSPNLVCPEVTVASARQEMLTATVTLTLTSLLLPPGLLSSHCPDRPGWFLCNGTTSCLSPAQVCDGLPDCEDGSDEAGQLCSGWRCEEGVRCEDGGACIRVAHQVVCAGQERAVCQDGSDLQHCRGPHRSHYSGCLLATQLGLTIADCARCLCQLRDSPYRSRHLQADVCLAPDSPRLCDGVEDCVGGEDETEEICPQATASQEDLQQTQSLQITTIIFVISLICLCSCCLVILIMLKLCLNKRHQSDDGVSKTAISIMAESPKVSSNVYVVDSWRERPTWSLTTTKIIKELGTGYFSKVFMSEDKYRGYVAVKTAHPSNSEMAQRSIMNEISILKELGKHSNIIQIVDSNLEERLLVLEYCLYGNCKDYIARNKNLFVSQIDPDTKEMKIDEKEDFLFINNDFLDTKTLIRWSIDISRGLSYLAKMNIIHRDLALRNILLSGKRTVKISDFGLAVSVPGQYWSATERPVPYKHSAMESLASRVYSGQTDVWSLGVTLWEMFSLASEPHADVCSPGELLLKFEAGERQPGPAPPLAPLSLQTALESCWAEHPAHRPTARELTGLLAPLGPAHTPLPVRRDAHYSSPRSTPLVTSRSFYWTNYKVMKGQPVPCSEYGVAESGDQNPPRNILPSPDV